MNLEDRTYCDLIFGADTVDGGSEIAISGTDISVREVREETMSFFGWNLLNIMRRSPKVGTNICSFPAKLCPSTYIDLIT
jgi:hypothetical protein